MSKLFHVRHGQASFFSDHYDKLSEMGERQSRVLGEHWLAKGIRIDEVYCGTLQRQRRTAEVVGETYRDAAQAWPEIQVLPGLDEYDADSVMATLLPELIERDPQFGNLKMAHDDAKESKDRYITFHRLLEAVMAEYVGGQYKANGFERWDQFSGRVRDALKTILAAEGSGRNVAVFSSGGPIGVSVQMVLEAPEIKACELNWRVHNCSVTEFTFSGRRISLDSFNNVAHFTDPELLTFR